jgi:hypothetical protein
VSHSRDPQPASRYLTRSSAARLPRLQFRGAPVAVKRAIPKVSPRAAHSKPPLRSQRPNSAPPLTRLPAARHRLGRRSRPGRLHLYRLLHALFLFLKDGPDHITRGVATRRHEAPGMSAGAEQALAAHGSAPRAPDLVTGLLTDGSEHLNPVVPVLVHHGSWIAGEELRPGQEARERGLGRRKPAGAPPAAALSRRGSRSHWGNFEAHRQDFVRVRAARRRCGPMPANFTSIV